MRTGLPAAIVPLLAAAMVFPLVTMASGDSSQTTLASDRDFSGTWSATGTRQTLPVGGGGTAAIVHLDGAIVLTAGADLGAGFRGEAIGFDDGTSVAAGRAVWTDARGDRVYSTLSGEPLRTGRRIAGTITGGTGRFAGASGSYEMTWQYVVSGEGEAIQGRSADLRGRLRGNGVR
jgi:hypothetical protein